MGDFLLTVVFCSALLAMSVIAMLPAGYLAHAAWVILQYGWGLW
jgi:hypothetical protein